LSKKKKKKLKRRKGWQEAFLGGLGGFVSVLACFFLFPFHFSHDGCHPSQESKIGDEGQ